MENGDAQSSPLSSDLLGTVVRPPSIRVSRSFNLSGRLTPRSSPSFKRSPSVRTPARSDSRFVPPLPWYRKLLSRRLFHLLLVIGLWAYIGLLVVSRWGYDQQGGRSHLAGSRWQAEEISGGHVISRLPQHASRHEFLQSSQFSYSDKAMDFRKPVAIVKNGDKIHPKASEKEQLWSNQKPSLLVESEDKPTHSASEHEQLLVNHKATPWNFPSFGTVNSTIGNLIGPFDEIEKRILGPILRERPISCQSSGAFEAFVRGRSFMLIFHELSMTGSPLAMMELACEILSCGGKVAAVAQSQKGGLLQELMLRGIKVFKNKGAAAFKFAARADLLVAGSAVCASWIDKYLLFNRKGSRRIIWWIMENRKEYFDRSKHVLGMAKALVFLSDSQLKLWQAWSGSEGILLPKIIRVIPLSVNDELALHAGFYESNANADERRKCLREVIRSEIGVRHDDMLLTTLSSINPGKGQLKIVQALAMVANAHVSDNFGQQEWRSGSNETTGRLKLLIGSVGSKSNKADYIQRLVDFISARPYLANMVVWTPATVHVSSLYAASDAYVMNSQGLGETFGRVTVEAMAFGLPILGTDAGGTSEIVQANVSGMLHPVGSDGVTFLAEHINVLLQNETLRLSMGLEGKHRVESLYLKRTMYRKLAQAFLESYQEGPTS